MVSNRVGMLGGKETGKKKRASPDNNGGKSIFSWGQNIEYTSAEHFIEAYVRATWGVARWCTDYAPQLPLHLALVLRSLLRRPNLSSVQSKPLKSVQWEPQGESRVGH